jgi:hypothetical protein
LPAKNRGREATAGKGFPRPGALFLTIDIGHFLATAALAAEELPLPYNPIRRVRIGSEMMPKQGGQGSAQVFRNVGFQPFPVPEEGAKGERDLPMLIAFRAGRERTGISQNVAPVLEKLRLAIERMVDWQRTRKRRHDVPKFSVTPGTDAPGTLPLAFPPCRSISLNSTT